MTYVRRAAHYVAALVKKELRAKDAKVIAYWLSVCSLLHSLFFLGQILAYTYGVDIDPVASLLKLGIWSCSTALFCGALVLFDRIAQKA